MKNWIGALGVAATLGLGALALAENQATTTTAPAAAPKPEASAADFKTQNDKISYIIGMNLGRTMKRMEIDLDAGLILKGYKDGVSGQFAMTDEEVNKVMMAFQEEMKTKQTAKMQEMAVKNKKEGEDFLAANAKKEGVKTTSTGLQYKVVKEGNGPMPQDADTVKVHYKGTFIDGKVFDSTEGEGVEPAQLKVGNVIPGWTEALKMMKVGSKWQLWIPANLAYGDRQMPGMEPNSTLIFDVELVGILPPEKKDAEQGAKDSEKAPSAGMPE